MLEKTRETKVLRDVIHGYIHVDLQIIWELIDSKEFQRLRRIRQLGGDFQVYHNAEHSRFSHSLGVYEIVRRMVHEVHDLQMKLTEREKVVVMIAALLHDVGHLPFSHAFEHICPIPHERFSYDIIVGNSDVNRILCSYDEELVLEVASVIRYQHKNPILNQIVSGQLDADRMDYLLRDAYFTGTSYGAFDLERILRTIRVKDDKLVVKESGIHSVENYIMARYHMYWQVYYHPVCRSYEIVLSSLFKRMRYLYENGDPMVEELQMFVPFLGDHPSICDHFDLDENAAFYGIARLTKSDDEVIADLARRLLNRRLFEYETIMNDDEYKQMEARVRLAGYDPNYYCYMDTMSQSPYSPYAKESGSNIWVLTESGEVAELSQRSVIVKSLVEGDVKKESKVYFPDLGETYGKDCGC
ncbi:hypothetical protein EDD63_1666 [Breznakia blatticola]|uniref:HD/PDEase domain-containing protein n=1 Tax=Breznakia blatticola TaxID=1754012 RepID=A0A4R7ZFD4_9FIRM|nr:HD domain-containing protein [Breznakia blatticola]TDW08855.1 hypothetical protein EDD63_1666 [Breznakia blatticola]